MFANRHQLSKHNTLHNIKTSVEDSVLTAWISKCVLVLCRYCIDSSSYGFEVLFSTPSAPWFLPLIHGVCVLLRSAWKIWCFCWWAMYWKGVDTRKARTCVRCCARLRSVHISNEAEVTKWRRDLSKRSQLSEALQNIDFMNCTLTLMYDENVVTKRSIRSAGLVIMQLEDFYVIINSCELTPINLNSRNGEWTRAEDVYTAEYLHEQGLDVLTFSEARTTARVGRRICHLRSPSRIELWSLDGPTARLSFQLSRFTDFQLDRVVTRKLRGGHFRCPEVTISRRFSPSGTEHSFFSTVSLFPIVYRRQPANLPGPPADKAVVPFSCTGNPAACVPCPRWGKSSFLGVSASRNPEAVWTGCEDEISLHSVPPGRMQIPYRAKFNVADGREMEVDPLSCENLWSLFLKLALVVLLQLPLPDPFTFWFSNFTVRASFHQSSTPFFGFPNSMNSNPLFTCFHRPHFNSRVAVARPTTSSEFGLLF